MLAIKGNFNKLQVVRFLALKGADLNCQNLVNYINLFNYYSANILLFLTFNKYIFILFGSWVIQQ
jgi:hypothetical protein